MFLDASSAFEGRRTCPLPSSARPAGSMHSTGLCMLANASSARSTRRWTADGHSDSPSLAGFELQCVVRRLLGAWR
jgi:hypothetical protein